MENRKYYLRDFESGQPYEVTKEEYESFMHFMNTITPKLNEATVGKVIIYGTAGELESSHNLEKLFINPLD